MSLQVEERRRGRSRSPGGRDRSRSREPPARVIEASAPYPDDDRDGGVRMYDYEDPRARSYDLPYPAPSGRDRDARDEPDRFSYLPQKYAAQSEGRSRRDNRDRYDDDDLAYGAKEPPPPPSSSSYQYAQPKQYEYDRADDRLTYSSSRQDSSQLLVAGEPRRRDRSRSPGPSSSSKSYRDDPRGSSASIVTIEPGVSSSASRRSKRDSSPLPPTARMSSLSVSGGHHRSGSMSLAAAPPSPLLESYHGTYQSMSPMPSPLMIASRDPAGHDTRILDVAPLDSDDDDRYGGGDKTKRRARFADPAGDAERLAKALKGNAPPDVEPLIEILPGLTHEQIMTLRVEYKQLVKTGPDRKGVNIAKHIRSRLKEDEPNLMKACYAVALGKWESEAYWANYWYQGDKTRRELLIESLMGRTNDEIHEIKQAFSDKKYDNSLRNCMKTELKEDKFKKAVMMVLDEQRMEEVDRHGRYLPMDRMLIEDDVRALYRAVRSEKGGESAMIQIVIMRSDSHLREVLKLYSAEYRSNFARDALKKSGNLVGELLAHILNGVINKPVRDALLLQHALTASKRDDLRRELLTSRLVRFHWDRHHLADIKVAYRERYGKDLQEAVRDATGSSGWGKFCRELCITRMPDDVRRVERVSRR
ncbi:annexin ANXC4 [Pyricularia oryzae 70-15]|uniref:Annexin ANXC4 n=1 Tax=Pyricularia oryzae (strain 70-15 / ATCC MYA-4617 / FGSC 8958) TaxID=242507 RepID=G4N6H8_PYRO7|nr:annexin ANXC4 [Pyricularia oryzae 70-15]EHA49848.1 annexin ANXC4 [Pyricularia oryzae 70-15]